MPVAELTILGKPYRHITSEYLSKIARHKNVMERGKVAKHDKTAEADLLFLAKDIATSVRRSLLENPKISLRVLEILSYDPKEEIRESISLRIDISEEILMALSQDESDPVRANVVKNKLTPFHVLENLVKDEGHDTQKALARHPKMTSEMLHEISVHSTHQDVLGLIFYHPQVLEEDQVMITLILGLNSPHFK